MPLTFVKRYTRRMAQQNPTWLFVFGDNMERRGRGGQAQALRGEPNAVGIPTKWAPRRDDAAYFEDSDLTAVQGVIDKEFAVLERHLKAGHGVVWPEDGVGTGLSELPKRAPRIHAYIRERLEFLKKM